MTDQLDFIDSYAPIDEEICTDADWPMPEPKAWKPVEPVELSWWQRVKRWACGGESV